MSDPIPVPNPPIGTDTSEIDMLLYEMAEMLSKLPQNTINEILIRLRSVLAARYLDNFESDLLVIFSISPFSSKEENEKWHNLLTKFVKTLNAAMPPLHSKRLRLVNYIINTLRNIALNIS
ncbi:MAG: hypothetical protein QXX36_03565 [Candidatus Rehaiarchaeum fermentans]|nr:hypothetical protein [Candidatus Rehaiarchaeum fermentans]